VDNVHTQEARARVFLGTLSTHLMEFFGLLGEHLSFGNCAARNPNPREDDVLEEHVVCGDLTCNFKMTVPRDVGRWRCDSCNMEQRLPCMKTLPCYVSTSPPLAPRSPWWQRCGSPRSKPSSQTSGSKTSSYTSGSKTASYTSVDAHAKTSSPITSLATPKRGTAAQSTVFKSRGEGQHAFKTKDECHMELDEKTADKIERWLHRATTSDKRMSLMKSTNQSDSDSQCVKQLSPCGPLALTHRRLTT